MMVEQNINLCIRCGKQRVVVKTKKEYINSSLVYTTITSCPDNNCQKLVDVMLNNEKAFRDKIVKNQEEREKILRYRRKMGRRRKENTEK